MIFRLPDNDLYFPDPELAEEDGLLAIGGDLSTERLVLAYTHGIFPWFSENEPICWYAPHERCVIFPDKLKVSKSMKQLLKSGRFEITINQAFADVIRNCADIPRHGEPGTWITSGMQKAYIELHQAGLAHSVEVWQNGQLAGGLYGIKINRVFCGESMFSRISNASKTALIYLCQNYDLELIDCQLPNPHLFSMGAEMIGRKQFMEILNKH